MNEIINNPLMNFARKVELTVKLPSNGNWYENGMINYTPNGEVEILPMLPKDELMMANPDALLSGKANIDLIKSCVPSIKDPEKLLYPDANVLFLAIHRATYGNELNLDVSCPHCRELMAKMSESEIVEAEKNGELTTHSQRMTFDIDSLLTTISFLDEEYTVELDNGLTIYVRPTLLEDKAKYGLMMFNQEKIISNYKNYDFEKSMENEDYKEIMKTINESYLKINEIGNEVISNCITKVKLPDQTFVDDKDMIHEFVLQTESKYITLINKKITEITEKGLTTELSYECQYCGHKWNDKFYGYNQTDFFGISSYS